MIVTVCLNPAIDVTYRVLELSVGRSHRVLEVHARAGGKGVNVARVLHQLDEPVTVAGLCGGATGAEIAADLQRSGLPAAFTLISGQSRRTVTVVDARDATVFNEPGPPVSAAEWTAFTAAFDEIAKAGRVVVASGSVPPGCPDTAYAELVAIARANGAAVVLDAEGEQLRHALGAHSARDPTWRNPMRPRSPTCSGGPSAHARTHATPPSYCATAGPRPGSCRSAPRVSSRSPPRPYLTFDCHGGYAATKPARVMRSPARSPAGLPGTTRGPSCWPMPLPSRPRP